MAQRLGLRWALVLLLEFVSATVLYWSEIKNTSADLCTNQHCVVPAGEVWTLDSDLVAETLTIQGMLKWDAEFDGLEIQAAYVLVEQGGYLKIGTAAAPMVNRATINITRRPVETHSHSMVGYRFLATAGQDSSIEIHGRRLERTWTLLARTVGPGSTQIFIKDDPVVMGWMVGDRIGIATTNRGNSSIHTISSIGPASEWQLSLKRVQNIQAPFGRSHNTASAVALGRPHWGSWCKNLCIASDRFFEVGLDLPSNISRLRLQFDEVWYAPRYIVEVQETRGSSWFQASAVANAVGGWQDVLLGLSGPVLAFRLVVDPASLEMRPAGHQPSRGAVLHEVEVFGSEVDGPRPNVLHLEEPLQEKHRGGFRTIGGRSFEMAAEVVNLERSVLITGEHETFHESQQGIHTAMFGLGTVDIRYARVEYCGQRNVGGRYCLHFHNGGSCKNCAFQGNAVVDSHQVGIAIDHTHRTLVDSNVLWDARGAGVYIKDGNEMYNTVSRNVAICSEPGRCAVPWLDHPPRHTAGIFMIGMTNNLEENRVVGYENGIWAAGDLFPDGQGHAVNKVCPQYTPFGIIRGNVNHDCQRYGLRLGRQRPRNLERNENGFVTDLGTCGEFRMDGSDNGVVPASVVEDSLEWHNMFVGGFSTGDISFRGLVSVNNGHSMIWKESKNFADGDSKHIEGSIFANDPVDPYGRLQVQGPAGPFAFLLDDVAFLGGPTDAGALSAGFLCGRANAGGPCAVQYLLRGVNFTGMQRTAKRIKFGDNSMPAGRTLPMFLSDDDSLGGYKSVLSGHLRGFAGLPGCQSLGEAWDHGIGCDAHARRLHVKSKNLGVLTVTGPGYEDAAAANMSEPVLGVNAGRMMFEDNLNTTTNGYSTPVLVGRNYSLAGAWRGDVVFEFSDVALEAHFGQPERLNLAYAGLTCEARPQALRAETMFATEVCELRDGGDLARDAAGEVVDGTEPDTVVVTDGDGYTTVQGDGTVVTEADGDTTIIDG